MERASLHFNYGKISWWFNIRSNCIQQRNIFERKAHNSKQIMWIEVALQVAVLKLVWNLGFYLKLKNIQKSSKWSNRDCWWKSYTIIILYLLVWARVYVNISSLLPFIHDLCGRSMLMFGQIHSMCIIGIAVPLCRLNCHLMKVTWKAVCTIYWQHFYYWNYIVEWLASKFLWFNSL